MSIEKIPGQERAKRFLTQMMKRGQVPHALLFSGMAGIGKRAMALEMAKAMNCLDPPGQDCCDGCVSCRKITGGSHPDVLLVRSQGAFIKVDQIRELKERARFRPFEAKVRVVIIEDAQRLKDEAANAILKMLEEPPPQNVFALTVLEPQMLLPTIVSRCCHIRFQPLDDSSVARFLVEKGQFTESQADRWSALAGGSLERAGRIVEGRWIEHMQEVVSRLEKLCEAPMSEFFSTTGQWTKKTEDLEEDLECIKLVLGAWVLGRLHLPLVLPLERLGGRLMRQACEAPLETLFELQEEAEEALRRLRLNANKQLTLESLCLAIRKGLDGQSDRNSLPNGR